MKPELPPYITPRGPNDRRRQRQVRRRRWALAGFFIIVVVVVVALAVALPGSNKASSSTTSSTSQAPSVSTTTTSLGAATTTSATVAPANAPLTYSAELTGENETPAVSTSASGTLTLTAAADGSSVDYVLKVDKITNLTVARLHEGKAGVAGATILTLYGGPTKTGVFSGTLTQGSFAAADLVGSLKGKTMADLVALIEAGSVYLNVGTSAHTLGEIRGQLQ
jgi:hypothetical protein